jgi:acetolactate synthase small subunit
MTASVELMIAAAPGVENLARVVGVFALLGVTPDLLVCEAARPDLRVRAQFAADEAVVRRCIAKLQSLFAVRRVVERRLSPRKMA